VTGFKFLHAADLHLGSPFHGLSLRDEAVARRFAEASRGAFTALVGRAIEENVAFIVIAGDVYDGDWRDNSIGLFFNRELARLERAGIEVFLLRGNHDAESVITRSITLPPSVKHFSTTEPTTFRIEALQVALHGQGFAQRAVTDNLVLNYPGRISGWFNIGVLHTALTGHPPHDNYAPSTLGHLRARGYDYWALGHVHDFEVVQTKPHIVYPGNLQGRGMREQGEKGAVMVAVLDGAITGFERVIVDRARWAEITIDLRGVGSEAEVVKLVEEKLKPLGIVATERLMAVRVVLTGESEVHRQLLAHREQLTDEVKAASHRVHGDIWLERLDINTTAPRQSAGERTLRSVDLAALLSEVDHGADLREKARQLISEVRARIPGTIPAEEQDLAAELPQLIAEARELLLTRAADEA
jgi:DNA repair exonuclease SbcCD nuclease subunit